MNAKKVQVRTIFFRDTSAALFFFKDFCHLDRNILNILSEICQVLRYNLSLKLTREAQNVRQLFIELLIFRSSFDWSDILSMVSVNVKTIVMYL